VSSWAFPTPIIKRSLTRCSIPAAVSPGGDVSTDTPVDPFAFLHERFSTYIAERMTEPRDDIMAKLVTTPFPNGSMPEQIDAVRTASLLFIAGFRATAGLIATGFQVRGEDPALQQRLRDDSTLIPSFIEEALLIDSELKGSLKSFVLTGSTHASISPSDEARTCP
jgi:cytochrome P450 family 150 subfamily A5